MNGAVIYLLRLRPAPGVWRAPVECRLRAGLKRLLRSYGLRCVGCRPARKKADALRRRDSAARGRPAATARQRGENPNTSRGEGRERIMNHQLSLLLT